MKTTILTRIILATVLPLVLVFALVITTINQIVAAQGRKHVFDSAQALAHSTGTQIRNHMEATIGLLAITGRNIAGLDLSDPDDLRQAENILLRLTMAHRAFRRTWMVLEPGEAIPGRYQRIYLQDGDTGLIRQVRGLAKEIFQEPGRCPWYSQPMGAQRPYANLAGFFEYAPQARRSLVITYPIVSGGRARGVIGLSVNYKELIEPDSIQITPGQKTMLLAEDGLVLYSNDPADEGRNVLKRDFQGKSQLTRALRRHAFLMDDLDSPLGDGEGKALVTLFPVNLRGETSAGGFLFFCMPASALYDPIRDMKRLIASTSLLGAILLFFSVFFATRSIARPIRRLSDLFTKVSGGDITVVDALNTAAVPVEGGDQPRDSQGRPLADLPSFSNITEIDAMRLALRQMLRQILEAQEARVKATEERLEKERVIAESKAQGYFFANVSHEIRTPMNAILGIAEIALHDETFSDRGRKYAQDVKFSAEALLNIINDILDMSKIESGKMDLVPVNFSLPAFLDNVASIAGYLANDKGLKFSCAFAPGLPEWLFGDDGRLRQIMLNLIGNAVKFTPEGGEVALAVTREGEGFLRYAVSDTGIGIKAEDQPLLFKSFQQVDKLKNKAIHGTGLGLAICRSLAGLMGGRMELQSEYGRGSTFSAVLPLVPGERPADGGAVYQPGQGGSGRAGAKILVVDDNDLNRQVAAGLLRKIFGLSADLAAGGAEAVAMVQLKDYDLVFMDHMMPDMDGLEATRRIRGLGGRFAGLKIIAMTANAAPGSRDMLLAAGMDDFLPKPIRKKDLSDILKKWLG